MRAGPEMGTSMIQHHQASRPWTLTIFLLPLALALLLLGVKILAPAYYHDLIQEDCLLENLQFIFYLAAAILALLAAAGWRRAGRGWPAGAALLLGLLLLVVAGDEISWAERILRYHLPQFFARYNVQREVSLHNLRVAQECLHTAYLLAGLILGLGWLAAKRLAAWTALPPWLRGLLAELTPPWTLTLYFLPTFLLYGYFIVGFWLAGRRGMEHVFAVKEFIIWRDQEAVELLLSLGCLLWTAGLWARARRARR